MLSLPLGRRRAASEPTTQQPCPPWRDGNRRRAYPDIHAECEPTGVGTGVVGHGGGAALREFGGALFQRPTRSGEVADAGIYWNAVGRANLLVFPCVLPS